MTIETPIAVGMHMFTANGDKIGKVSRFDPLSDFMVVQHGTILHHHVDVPISLVGRVEVGANAIYLAASTADLQWADSIEPEQSLFEPH
jgi:hypothetical protein